MRTISRAEYETLSRGDMHCLEITGNIEFGFNRQQVLLLIVSNRYSDPLGVPKAAKQRHRGFVSYSTRQTIVR